MSEGKLPEIEIRNFQIYFQCNHPSLKIDPSMSYISPQEIILRINVALAFMYRVVAVTICNYQNISRILFTDMQIFNFSISFSYRLTQRNSHFNEDELKEHDLVKFNRP